MPKRKSYGSISKTTHFWWNSRDTEDLPIVKVSKEQLRKAFDLPLREYVKRTKWNDAIEALIYKKIKI